MLLYGECEEAGGLGFDGLANGTQDISIPFIYFPGLRWYPPCAQHWPKLPLEGSHCWASYKTEGCELCLPLASAGPSQGLCTSQEATRHSGGFPPPAPGRRSLHKTNTKCNRYNQPEAVSFHQAHGMVHSGLNSAKGVPLCCLPCGLGVPPW